MNAYIPALKEQHEKILTTLQAGELYWNQGLISECRTELENLLFRLTEHTYQESEFFFERVRPSPKMNQGGPFCTYFFEFFMHNRPLIVVEKLIASIRGEKPKLEIPDYLNRYFTDNSLLTIPLEEHLAMEHLTREMVQVLHQYDGKKAKWLQEAFDVLKDLIATNHRKEETCLWVAAQQALDPQAYAELSKTCVFQKK